VITGFNTDVEHDGVVYHVQTEDKGLDNPIILSLVYTGGAILASKRAPYDDLIAAGFDESLLAERLQRQHKLICAAIHSGRVEDLKRMSERAPGEKSAKDKPSQSQRTGAKQRLDAASEDLKAQEVGGVSADKFSISGSASVDSSLRVALVDETELHAGEFVSLKVQVSRTAEGSEGPVPRARVVLKTLGTSFQPASTFSITDNDGVALISASLPLFESGRAAILLRAEADGQTAELRRVVLPA
jgi:hypothetical protein